MIPICYQSISHL